MWKWSLLFGALFATQFLAFSGVALAAEDQDEVEDEGAVDDEEDQLDDEGQVEDDEAEVEDDEGEVEEDSESTETDVEKEDEIETLTAHPDTSTAVIFSTGEEVELVAGKMFTSYIHFANTGSRNFIMTSVTGSFRYPQDYSYVIQNFTSLPLNKMIDGGKEGSFVYQFLAAEMASGRPFGLVLSLNYKDTEDKQYQDTVYNKTVTVQENEEGVDAETFFMYVTLAALLGLALFGIYHVVGSKSKRVKRVTTSAPVEMGTGDGNVDYSWIPQDTLKSMNKGSPSPRRSPRKRTSKRAPANEAE
ncbi:translocon-associated protein subunit alpha-like [Styela clava]